MAPLTSGGERPTERRTRVARLIGASEASVAVDAVRSGCTGRGLSEGVTRSDMGVDPVGALGVTGAVVGK
jgi:hypothetical protein